MPIPKFSQLIDEYARLWDGMTVRDTWKSGAVKTSKKILSNKEKYLEVQQATNVPWYWVGCVHSLESALNFSTHLHNGDPLTRRTRLVPAGRPLKGDPPFTFMESAIDALTMKGLHEIKTWSIERICFEWERYNGWGYRRFHPSTLSPYLWSGSYHYKSGKYVADGRWSSSAVSQQIGTCVLLKTLCALDADIKLFGEKSGLQSSV